MRKSGIAEQHRMLDRALPNCQIMFDRRVFDYVLDELRRYPGSEEGGKYIGYVEQSEFTGAAVATCRIAITDFLPGGPAAKRTSVEFLPDGEFQERLFRQAEKRDPKIEHVGTWHSHHCNGLERLSEGDIRGYFKTVNKPAYRLSFFVASLVKRIPQSRDDTNWIDHFLFVRGDDSYYKVTEHVQLIDTPSSFGDITGHDSTDLSASAESSCWHNTETGRRVLAEDKRFFEAQFGRSFRATRKQGIVTIRCSESAKYMAVSYPALADDKQIRIEVGASSRTVLTMQCDDSDRAIAYVASLSALQRCES